MLNRNIIPFAAVILSLGLGFTANAKPGRGQVGPVEVEGEEAPSECEEGGCDDGDADRINGGECSSDADCDEGEYCFLMSGHSANGTCGEDETNGGDGADEVVGGECTSDADCDEGEYCFLMSGHPASGTCGVDETSGNEGNQ